MTKIVPIHSSSKHPKEMYWLAFIEMCQRFAFWGIGNLLVLYLVSHLGFQESRADHIYGLFSGIAFILPLLGGYVADRTCHFRSVILGSCFTIVGSLLMVFSHQKTLCFALFFAALGAGLFTPSIYALLGRLYHEKHHLREGGFSIYYASVNIGVFLATISMGSLGHHGMWPLAFFLAASIQALGLMAFLYIRRRPQFFKTHSIFLQKREEKPLHQRDKHRILLILILSVLSIMFWMAYNQGWSSMSIFILKYTDKHLGALEFAPSWILSTESLFLVLLAYPLACFYKYLSSKNKNPSPTVKMIFSFLFMGGCFFLLSIGSSHLTHANSTGAVSPLYVIGGYFFMALAEMLLAPIGLALVTHLSPHRYTAFLVGFWYVCIGIAYYLGASLASLMDRFTYLREFFEIFTIACLATALILIIFEKILSKLRHID